MATVQVRYIVNDVDEAIDFYTRHLGFKEEMHPAPIFAMLSRGDLRLVVSQPGSPPGKFEAAETTMREVDRSRVALTAAGGSLQVRGARAPSRGRAAPRSRWG